MIKKLVLNILIIIFIFVFIYSTFKISIWFSDNNKTNILVKYIYKNYEVTEKEDSSSTIVVPQKEEIPKFNYYWDYIKTNYIDENIDEIKKENSDTVAWLYVGGTYINYPVVKTIDNDYYLTKSFDKSTNQAGWIFADYRNKVNLDDKNLIIYGHGRLNQVMFGSLKNILESPWLNNPDNYLIKLSTQTDNMVYQVFSVYVTDYTTDYLKFDFNSEGEFLEFSSMLLSRSSFDFKTTISDNDKIITLSTCLNENHQRVVMHAKLIKSEPK